MMNTSGDSEVTFRKPAEMSAEPDLKKQAVIDYCSYFACHEARKETEAQRARLKGYRPLSRRFKGRRVF